MSGNWRNNFAGLGDPSRDRGSNTFWAGHGSWPSYSTLADAFRGDDIVALVASSHAEAITRPKIHLVTDTGARVEAVEDRLVDLDYWRVAREAYTWEDLFGGSAILLGTGDPSTWGTPLVPGAETVTFLWSLDPREIQPCKTGVLAQESEFFRVTRGGLVKKVHRSRLVMFWGSMLPARERAQRQGFGWSPVLHAWDEIAAFGMEWSAIRSTVLASGQSIYGIEKLAVQMATQAGREKILERLDRVERFRSTLNAIVIDKDKETWTRVADPSLASLQGVLEQFFQRLAIAVRRPVEVLLGRAPAGLNSTGSFPKALQDERAEERRGDLGRRTLGIARFLAPDLGIETAFTAELPPLREQTPVEKAEEKEALAKSQQAQLAALQTAQALGVAPELIQRAAIEIMELDVDIEAVVVPSNTPTASVSGEVPEFLATRAQRWVGIPGGDRLDLEVTVGGAEVKGTDANGALVIRYFFTTPGALLTWDVTGPRDLLTVGATRRIRARVRAHDELDGVKVTRLQKVTVSVPGDVGPQVEESVGPG